jgi:hypothetical protein
MMNSTYATPLSSISEHAAKLGEVLMRIDSGAWKDRFETVGFFLRQAEARKQPLYRLETLRQARKEVESLIEVVDQGGRSHRDGRVSERADRREAIKLMIELMRLMTQEIASCSERAAHADTEQAALLRAEAPKLVKELSAQLRLFDRGVWFYRLERIVRCLGPAIETDRVLSMRKALLTDALEAVLVLKDDLRRDLQRSRVGLKDVATYKTLTDALLQIEVNIRRQITECSACEAKTSPLEPTPAPEPTSAPTPPPPAETSPRLYEVKHPSSAWTGNYFNRDCHAIYHHWDTFLVVEDPPYYGRTDPVERKEIETRWIDMNLVYRWDWRLADPKSEDENEREYDRLLFFFVGQRKAILRSVEVYILPAERDRIESLARAWLKPRFDRLREIWSPFA